MVFKVETYLCSYFPGITDDGKLDTESDSGAFWVLFGGFAPIGRKVANDDEIIPESTPPKLYWFSSSLLLDSSLLISNFFFSI